MGSAFSPIAAATAEENGEHHDLQDFVARHRINDAGRHRVRDKYLQREGLRLNGRDRSGIVGDEINPRPRLEQINDHQPQRNRQQRGANKQEKVFENIRPSVLASPILAMPTTSVDITSGAIIIFTMRKNIVVKIEISCAYDFAVSADAILLIATPAIMPSIRPNMIILVKLIFSCLLHRIEVSR